MAGISKTITFDTVATDSFAKFRGTFEKQFYQSRPLFNRLFKSGKIKRKESGGEEIRVPVWYGISSQTQAFDGMQTFTPQRREYKLSSWWRWANVCCPMVVAHTDLRQYEGAPLGYSIDRYKEEMEASMDDFINYFANKLVEDGTGDGGQTFTGIKAHIADDPTSGTLAGIPRTTYEFWRNQVMSSCGSWFANGFGGTGDDDKVADMITQLQDGNEFPDLIMVGRELYLDMIRTMMRVGTEAGTPYYTPIYQVSDPDNFKMGVRGITYMGVPVEWDRTIGGLGATAGRMYFFNTKHWELAVDPNWDFDQIGWRSLEGQAAMQFASVNALMWRGELICKAPFRQGLCYGWT